jgi:4-hydroxy-2-oxoheptanedioate aldolase
MNPIRQSWSEGKPSIGTVAVGLTTSIDAERLGRAGFDWVMLDLQHGGFHWDAIIPFTQAIELGGARAVVRVPWISPPEIMRALDYGAAGVIVPMVSTAEDAALAAGATRYPPLGYRSNGRVRHTEMTHAEVNRDVVCVVMIETAEAMQNLDAIASTPGVDALIIGPFDLAIAHGWPLDNVGGDDVFLDAAERVIEAAERHGKAAGMFCFNADQTEALLQRGARFVAHNEGSLYADRGERTQVADWKARWRAPSDH